MDSQQCAAFGERERAHTAQHGQYTTVRRCHAAFTFCRAARRLARHGTQRIDEDRDSRDPSKWTGYRRSNPNCDNFPPPKGVPLVQRYTVTIAPEDPGGAQTTVKVEVDAG